jgi:predicted transcriptional regulator
MSNNLTPDDLVRREVYYCVSSLVSTLAAAYDDCANKDLNTLCEQAMEIACPIDDWEEAAIQAGWHELETGGWHHDGEGDNEPGWADSAQEACETDNLDPYQREVFEHWIVSDWLAEKLAARGEKVDTDFAGMTVWARTTTGQGIANDSVIESICRDLPGEIEAALAAISQR